MTKHESFRATRIWVCLGCALLSATLSIAQITVMELPAAEPAIPLDDIVQRSIMDERQTLKPQPIREADILWEKRIWRILDVREKQNLPFAAPESPLFTVLAQAAVNNELIVAEDDRFTRRMDQAAIKASLVDVDTILVVDPVTGEETVRAIQNEIDWEDVKRYRIEETWYFDKNTSQLCVQIIGIAPLLEVKDENGDFRFERPLFWVQVPSAREVLARHKVITPEGNYAATVSWDDWLQMRRFSAVIIKENNVKDRRLENYLSGRDLVLEGQKINDALFNLEQDAWQH